MNSNHAFTVRKGLTPKKVTSPEVAGSPVNTGVLASGGAALGSNTKSSSPLDASNRVQAVRSERYGLLDTIRNTLWSVGVAKQLEYPANYHRTIKCQHTRVKKEVQVKKTLEHGKAHYVGVSVCGNVWTCPVCAAKIQERRRAEIAKAFDYAYSNGRKMVMVTLTFPHTAADRLSDLLAMQSDAFRRLRSGKAWQKKKSEIEFGGLIRSLEITNGDNGWHPHTHEAWIVANWADAEALRAYIATRWFNVCKRAGLVTDEQKSAFMAHSVDVKDRAHCSEYLAKQDDSRHWGVDRELAKASSKKGKKSGKHPFALAAMMDAKDKEGVIARAKWLEYTEAMHGKRQLFWSHGLKDLVGVEDMTDEEAAEKSLERSITELSLDAFQWNCVIVHHAMSYVLDLIENVGRHAVLEWLEAPFIPINSESKIPPDKPKFAA